MAIPKGFRYKLYEMAGIFPDLGDCHGRLRLPRNDRNVLRSPLEQNDKLQFISLSVYHDETPNATHELFLSLISKC